MHQTKVTQMFWSPGTSENINDMMIMMLVGEVSKNVLLIVPSLILPKPDFSTSTINSISRLNFSGGFCSSITASSSVY